MTKYFLLSVSTDTMEIGMNAYDTYAEAYEQMEFEYNLFFNGTEQHSDIDTDRAYIVNMQYEYKWEIKKMEIS